MSPSWMRGGDMGREKAAGRAYLWRGCSRLPHPWPRAGAWLEPIVFAENRCGRTCLCYKAGARATIPARAGRRSADERSPRHVHELHRPHVGRADRPRRAVLRPLFEGQATDIMVHAQEILNLKKRLNEIYVHHTGQPLKKIEDALERDYFLTAEMAVEFGVVDKVINQRPTQPATAAA